MNISRKLYKEDIILLNEFQTELLKKDKRITQKDLIDKAIKFSTKYKNKFLSYVFGDENRDNRRAMTDKFLSLPKVDLGENWMGEIDTIEHDDMLRRNKKQ